VFGPFPGSVHDITTLREGGLLAKLPARERFLADKGYEGEERALTPFKR